MTPGRIAAALFAALATVIALTAYTWIIMADTTISWHGIAAIGVGVGLAVALGAGLMTLVFYSSRSGHDDDVGHQ